MITKNTILIIALCMLMLACFAAGYEAHRQQPPKPEAIETLKINVDQARKELREEFKNDLRYVK